MKRLVLVGLMLFICYACMYAQTPQMFNYQAVVRDAGGVIIVNTQVNVNIVIHEGSPTGTSVLDEMHTTVTNGFGLVNLQVGSVQPAQFSSISWGSNTYYMEIIINGVSVGVQQMMSVPYALFANQAASSSNDLDNDPANELQVLSVSNDTLYLTSGGFAVLSAYSDTLWRLAGSNIYNTNSGKVGVGTNAPPAKLVVQGDSSMADTVPLFEVKDKSGHTVFIVYQDSARLFVGDDGSKTSKGAFAVSGRNTAKQATHDYLWITPDSTRIFTSDTEAGFGVENIQTSGSQRYMRLTPDNYYIGHESGLSNVFGLYNSYYGYQTGKFAYNSSYNTLLGYQAGYNLGFGGMAAQNNCIMGYQAGYTSTAGDDNVFIGFQSGFSNNLGTDNVFLGSQSGYSNTNGTYNLFLGKSAGYYNTDGSHNVFIGKESGLNNTTGFGNVFLGQTSGKNNVDGYFNIFLGFNAGFNNLSGVSNLFIGNNSGAANTSGNYNLCFGYYSGRYNKTGTGNIYIGKESGYADTLGTYNIFLGERAGYAASNSNNNICIGLESGYSIQESGFNVMIGRNSGYSTSSGVGNVLLGSGAGYNNTTGSYNLFLGYSSGIGNTTGQQNIAIGRSAGGNNLTGSGNLFIGNWAGNSETQSDRLYIENSAADSTQALIFGRFDLNKLRVNNYLGVGRAAAVNAMEVQGEASKTTAGSWLANSDKRIKTEIAEIENASEIIMKLRPVKFKYTNEWMARNPSIKNQFYYNYIAQEYATVFPESVKGSGEFLANDKNEILQIDTYNAQIITVKAVQELIEQNRQLKEDNMNQQKTIDALSKRIEKLESK